MRRAFTAGVMVVAALWALPAAAQNATGGAVPAGPIINSWYLGGNGGIAVVEKVSGTAGVEGGIRVWKSLDLIGQIAWVQDSASRAQIEKVATLATSLAATTGAPTSSTQEAPALYSGLGARWVIEREGIRPYFLATVGGAKVELKPTVSLNGSDVTSSLPQYGITMGQDVIGKYNHFAAEGGAGVLMGFGTFYVDVGARIMSIGGDDHVNVARLVFGGGYRF